MKRLAAACLAALLSVMSGAPATAQDYDRDGAIAEYGPFFVEWANPGVIYLDGEITDDANLRLAEALEEHRFIHTMALSSVGGSVDAALAVARRVKERRMATIVPFGARCYSACALIYISGESRSIAGTLGVHQFDGGNSDSRSIQALVADHIELAIDNDIDPTVLLHLFRTGPSDMYIFTPDEIAAYGLAVGEVTAYVREPDLARVTANEDIDAVFGRPELVEEAMIAGFGDVPTELEPAIESFVRDLVRHPRFQDYFLERIRPAIEAGLPADDFGIIGAQIGAELFDRGMQRLPPEQGALMLEYLAALSDWMARSRPDACPDLMIGMGGDDTVDLVMEFLVSQDPAVAAGYFDLILAGVVAEITDDPPLVPLTRAQALDAELILERSFENAILAMDPKLAARLQGQADAPETVCIAVGFLFDMITALPTDDRTLIVRWMFQDS